MMKLRSLFLAIKGASLSTLGPIVAVGGVGLRISGGVVGCPFAIPFVLCRACPTPCTFLAVLPWLFSGVVAIGLVVGNVFCGLVCPFGVVSGALFRVPAKKISVEGSKSGMRYLKYVALVLFFYILYEAARVLVWSSPSGFWSFMIANKKETSIIVGVAALLLLVSSIFIYRPWCRLLCPLGTALSMFNRFSLLSPRRNLNKCKECQPCTRSCPIGLRDASDSESCLRCFSCFSTCQGKGLQLAFAHRWRT